MSNTLNLGDGNWGVKDSSLLGYAPDGSKFIPETFDVTRASGGTRVNKSGLIETVTEILSGELITIGNDTADIVGLADNSNLNIQTSFLTLSKRYKITFEVYDYVEGAIYILRPYDLGVANQISSNGTYSYTEIADASTSLIFKTNGTSTTLKLRNISVVEVNQDNLARIDYTDGVDGVLLTEPQSTNLIATSYVGTPKSPAVGLRNYLAPNGEIEAWLIEPTATSQRFEVEISASTYASGTELAYSWYRKRVSTPIDTSFEGDLDVKSGVNATSGVTTQISTNISGYDRFMVVFTITDGALDSTLRLYYGNVIGVGNSSVAYWGHQLEDLSYATSYMPTYGAIASRSGDLVNNGGSVTNFNSLEGVLFVEIAALVDSTDPTYISLSDGTTNNRVSIYQQDIRVRTLIVLGGATQLGLSFSVGDNSVSRKIAFKYKENDFSLWIDGVEVDTATVGLTFPINTLNELAFDNGGGGNTLYGKTKNVQVFNEALSDAELITLTTI